MPYTEKNKILFGGNKHVKVDMINYKLNNFPVIICSGHITSS